MNVDRSYTVNGLNQLTTAGAATATYDLRGNLTRWGNMQYGYDSKNQMTSATLPNGVTTLTYDGFGRAMQFVNTNDNRYVYDGEHMATQSKVTSGVAAIARRFVWGPSVDEVIATYEGATAATRRWPIADEKGSVVAVTDDAGAAVAFNKYDEFGVPSAVTGQIGYAGQPWINSLGLSYNKARFYSPSLGRFMQTDPIGYNDGLNWYNYVDSDPVNFVDPSGLKKVWPACPTGDCVNGNPGGGGLPGGSNGGSYFPSPAGMGLVTPSDDEDSEIVVNGIRPRRPKYNYGSRNTSPAVQIRLGVCRLATIVKGGSDAVTSLGVYGSLAGAAGGAVMGGPAGAVAGATPGLVVAGVASDVSSGAQLAIDLSHANSFRDVGVASIRAGFGVLGGRLITKAIAPFRIGPHLGRAQQLTRNNLAGGIGGQLLNKVDAFFNDDNGCK